MLLDHILVPTKLIVLGMVIGAASGLALAQFDAGPTLAAVADHYPFTAGKALDTRLLHLGRRYFAIATTPDISFAADSTSIVRKIGYGETSYVTVATTASGVYSSDGFADRHVNYPGVLVEHIRPHLEPWGLFGWSKLTG